MLFISTKAQAWYIDFAAGLLIFIFTLLVYYNYTINFQRQEDTALNSLIRDAKSISSSLTSIGYPSDWNNSTVVIIGIVNERILNTTKLKRFKQLNYTNTKSKFATSYDYFIFFTNSKDEVLNINGICGAGSPTINTSHIINSAYYYSDNNNAFMKDFMNSVFHSDIYFGDNPLNVGDIDDLMSRLSRYNLLIMEQPSLPTTIYDLYKNEIENYSSNGGLILISGQLTTNQGKNLVGANFFQKPGQTISDRNSTVNNNDQFLSLSLGESIVFAQANYVENTSTATGFLQIATFNSDSENAISKWQFGNGTIYFFSDFNISYYNGNFINAIEDATQSLVGGTCTPVNASTMNAKDIAKIERYLTYNSKIIKMEIYAWQ